MSPPEKEKAALVKTATAQLPNYDKPNVPVSDRKCNGKDSPPRGYGEVYDDKGNREVVPVTMPPVITEADLTMLRIISEAIAWCDGSRVKWTAFCVAVDQDRRSSSAIAEQFKCSTRSVEQHVRAAREWLAELLAESEGA